MYNSNEVWLPVVGYEGLYEVSNLGKVRGLPKVNTRGHLLNYRVQKCLMASLKKNGVRSRIHVSVLVLEAFVGPKPEGVECCHSDDDRSNNVLSNLRWDTHKANMQEAAANGRMKAKRGGENAKAKLTEQEVISIRKMYATGSYSLAELGKTYNMSYVSISYMIRGKSWRHVDGAVIIDKDTRYRIGIKRRNASKT